MRAVAILVVGLGFFAVVCDAGCNSEATVCPNPAACDQTPFDSGGDAGSDADAPADVTPDAAAETG